MEENDYCNSKYSDASPGNLGSFEACGVNRSLLDKMPDKEIGFFVHVCLKMIDFLVEMHCFILFFFTGKSLIKWFPIVLACKKLKNSACCHKIIHVVSSVVPQTPVNPSLVEGKKVAVSTHLIGSFPQVRVKMKKIFETHHLYDACGHYCWKLGQPKLYPFFVWLEPLDFRVSFPICSMYGIFTYIFHKLMVNAGKYSIHGASGFGRIWIRNW